MTPYWLNTPFFRMMLKVNNLTFALGCEAMATVVILRLANSYSKDAGFASTSRSLVSNSLALAFFAESVVDEITKGAILIKSSSSCSRGVKGCLVAVAGLFAG